MSVRADTEHRSVSCERIVDFLHLENDVVRNVGFGEQDFHMSGQTTGDRMNRKTHVRAAFFKYADDFGERVLRLRDC
jgi:hypothetical protein